MFAIFSLLLQFLHQILLTIIIAIALVEIRHYFQKIIVESSETRLFER